MVESSIGIMKTADDLAKESRNKDLILGLFSGTGPDTITDLMREDYKQHNPTVGDGKAGAVKFFTDMFQRYPEARTDVAHIAADGDLVWVHAHLVRYPEDRGIALVDIFRVEDGKLVEHWDIMQDVPENSANDNSMF